MDDDKRDELFLQRLLKHQEQTIERKSYAARRMDLLIISLSGAGIYTIFETFKFFREKSISENLDLLKIAGFLFTIAIIINVISQWTGLKANEYEFRATNFDIDVCKGETVDAVERDGVMTRRNKWNNCTNYSNIISALSTIIGFILLLVFYLLTV